MTIDELRQESFFRQLSEGQQKFVIARCEGSDPKTAARAAWTCATDASATSMANKATKNVNIKWLIGRFFGKGAGSRIPTQEELAAWSWEKAQTVSDPALAIKYASTVADILGYRVRPMEPVAKQAPDDGSDLFEL